MRARTVEAGASRSSRAGSALASGVLALDLERLRAMAAMRAPAPRSRPHTALHSLLLYGLAAGTGWLATAPHPAASAGIPSTPAALRAPGASAMAMQTARVRSVAAVAGPRPLRADQPPAPHGRPVGLGAHLGEDLSGLLALWWRSSAKAAARADEEPLRGGRGVHIVFSDEWPFRPDDSPAPGPSRSSVAAAGAVPGARIVAE